MYFSVPKNLKGLRTSSTVRTGLINKSKDDFLTEVYLFIEIQQILDFFVHIEIQLYLVSVKYSAAECS